MVYISGPWHGDGEVSEVIYLVCVKAVRELMAIELITG